MKVLVTGASGMLGRATAQALLDRGDDVTVLQRSAVALDCRAVLGDLRDPDVVRRAVAGQEAIVHLAAKVDVVGPWREYDEVNVYGTRSVLRAARHAGVDRVVHVSSPSVAHGGSAIVGAGAAPADPGRARGHYARSKAMAEIVALDADDPSMAVVAVRPHLVWGPGDTQLIGRVVERARAGRLPLIDSGAALIDTTYVDNAVDALVAALDACARVRGEAFVVSNGEPRTIAEIFGKVCSAAGVPPPHRRVPYRVAIAAGTAVEAAWTLLGRRDTPPVTRFLAEQLATAHWFDQRRTREGLGWAPRVSLDEGFERLRASFRKGES